MQTTGIDDRPRQISDGEETIELTPRYIDEELQRLYGELMRLLAQRQAANETVYSIAGFRKRYDRRVPYWPRSASEMWESAQILASQGDERNLSYGLRPSEAMAKARGFDAGIAQARMEIDHLERVYQRDPWTRYFPCLNSDGHIHATLRACPTVRPDTPMGWTPELSGHSIEAAVDKLGPALCSVCFPEAPVEHKSMTLGQVEKERTRAERDAARAEREAKKAAKTLRPGEQFEDYSGWTVTTVAGAKKALRDEVEFRDYYGHGRHPSHPAAERAALRAAEVLLAREAEHKGWGAGLAEIDKIIANAVRKNRADGARI